MEKWGRSSKKRVSGPAETEVPKRPQPFFNDLKDIKAINQSEAWKQYLDDKTPQEDI
jgi:hypothetical protein